MYNSNSTNKVGVMDVPRNRDIPEQLSQLKEVVNNLNIEIDKLREQLRPVLNVIVKVVSNKESCGDVEANISPFSQEMRAINRDLSSIIAEIKELQLTIQV